MARCSIRRQGRSGAVPCHQEMPDTANGKVINLSRAVISVSPNLEIMLKSKYRFIDCIGRTEIHPSWFAGI